MIEPIMYLAIGFLVSMLFGLMIVPLVHNRAVRLTTRRLEAATPLSMAEIQADKDQLRAEFAMSARRLEMSVDQLKNKTTSQLAELGKKSDAINRMKIELGELAGGLALELIDAHLKPPRRHREFRAQLILVGLDFGHRQRCRRLHALGRQPHRAVVHQGHDHQPEQHRDQKTDRQIHDRLDHNATSETRNVVVSNMLTPGASASQMPR